MRVKAGASDGGSEDDYGHGSWHDSLGSADPRPPRNARTPTTEFDPPARSDVSRVPGGEPFTRGTLPRGRPRRGEMARALGLSDDERKLVQAAGLLHDVGHGPFSHTLEHVLSRELAV